MYNTLIYDLPHRVDATHEAGHAVVSLIEGRRFAFVTLQPTPGYSSAHVEPVRFPGAARYPFGFAPEHVRSSLRARRRLGQMIHILLAGGEADRLIFGDDHPWRADADDLHKVARLLATAVATDDGLADGDAVAAACARYTQETWSLVVLYQDAVKRLAEVLLEEETLSFAAVCQLVLPAAADWRYYRNGWKAAETL